MGVIFIKIWGHYETVKMQGTQRTTEVFIPSLLNSSCFPLGVFIMPFLIFLSGGEALEEWKSPGHILILLGFFAFGLLCVYGTYKVRKDYKRIQNGELVARTGELYFVSGMRSRISSGRPDVFRFAVRNYRGSSTFPEEIYEMPRKIYEKFLAQYQIKEDTIYSDLHSYLVEYIVLPPLDVPEFRCWTTSSKLRKSIQAISPDEVAEHYGKLPISRSDVIEIFYIKELPNRCEVGYDFLFSRQ